MITQKKRAVQRVSVAVRRPSAFAPRVLLLGLAITCGCAAGDTPIPPGAGGSEPAAAGLTGEHEFPGVVACDVAASGGVIHLLFGTSVGTDGKDVLLCHTRSDDGGATWSQAVPMPVAHGTPTKMHRGDDPQVAAHGDRVMALWTARGDGPFGSGPLATALSDDGGRTWRAGPSPSAVPLPADATPPRVVPAASTTSKKPGAAKGAGPGYRFPSAAASSHGFGVVWIHAAGEERSLRHATLAFDGSGWSEAAVVDPHICACCWNELKAEPDGTLAVLYRDQQPSDMTLARSRDGGRTWQNAGHAGRFGWNFDGCPHVGGGVATLPASGGGDAAVLATVWTGNPGSTGAYVMKRSGDGKWSAPTPLAADGSRGRNTDVAALPDARTAAAVWDQPAPEGGQSVFAVFTHDGGETWTPPRRLSIAGASYPRVVPAGDGFLVLWTEHKAGGESTLTLRTVKAN